MPLKYKSGGISSSRTTSTCSIASTATIRSPRCQPPLAWESYQDRVTRRRPSRPVMQERQAACDAGYCPRQTSAPNRKDPQWYCRVDKLHRP
jgi:hypothetical protein